MISSAALFGAEDTILSILHVPRGVCSGPVLSSADRYQYSPSSILYVAKSLAPTPERLSFLER